MMQFAAVSELWSRKLSAVDSVLETAPVAGGRSDAENRSRNRQKGSSSASLDRLARFPMARAPGTVSPRAFRKRQGGDDELRPAASDDNPEMRVQFHLQVQRLDKSRFLGRDRLGRAERVE